MKAANLIAAGLAALIAHVVPGFGAPSDISTAAAKCEACHNGGNPVMPRLDGQPAPYLAPRIRGFADLTRQNPHAYFMFDINASLSDAMVVALAKYLAAQPPVSPAGTGPLTRKGEHLYRSATAADGPACQSCHGLNAEGSGTAPRLAGQRAAYLREQLEDFSMFTRVHETMNMRTRRMSEDEINALVDFLSHD